MTARTRGTRKRQDAGHAEERALIELLSHGLWEEEIQRVLACALLAWMSGARSPSRPAR